MAALRVEHEFYAPALDPVSGHDQTEPRMVHQFGEGVFLRVFPHLVLHPTALSRFADTATAIQGGRFCRKRGSVTARPQHRLTSMITAEISRLPGSAKWSGCSVASSVDVLGQFIVCDGKPLSAF
jgi:hypothetical protein